MLLYLLLVLLPALVLGLGATIAVKSTFAKYARIGSMRGYTGAEAADEMLRRAGVGGVKIKRADGFLSDHYNPMDRSLNLSAEVYDSQSLSAIGVACHEAGHAIQHARAYLPLQLRSTLVPATMICSTLYPWIIMIGAIGAFRPLMLIGIAMCAVAVFFALVTLPVEWDASRRAKLAMANGDLLAPHELEAAGKVLNAAFLTYVASAVTALLTLLYYILQLNRRD